MARGRVNVGGAKLPFKVNVEKLLSDEAFTKGEAISVGNKAAFPPVMVAKKVTPTMTPSITGDLDTTSGNTTTIQSDACRLRKNANGTNTVLIIRQKRTGTQATIDVAANNVPDYGATLSFNAYNIAVSSNSTIRRLKIIRVTDEIACAVYYANSQWYVIAIKYSTGTVFSKGTPVTIASTMSEMDLVLTNDLTVLIVDKITDGAQAKLVPHCQALTINSSTLAITLGNSVTNTATIASSVSMYKAASNGNGDVLLSLGLSADPRCVLCMVTVDINRNVSFKPYITIIAANGSWNAALPFFARNRLYVLHPDANTVTTLRWYEITFNASHIITLTERAQIPVSMSWSDFKTISVVTEKDFDVLWAVPVINTNLLMFQVYDNNQYLISSNSYTTGNHRSGCPITNRLLFNMWSQVDYDFNRLYYATYYFKLDVSGFAVDNVNSVGVAMDANMVV